MDVGLGYITPHYVRQLHDGVLRRALTQYRHAARTLAAHQTGEGEALREQLDRVVTVLEEELARREGEAHVGLPAASERPDEGDLTPSSCYRAEATTKSARMTPVRQ